MPLVAVFNALSVALSHRLTGASALKREGNGHPFLSPIIISQAHGALQTLIPDSASNMTYRSETGTLQELCTRFFMLFNLIHSLVGITSGCALRQPPGFNQRLLFFLNPCTPILEIVL